MLTGGGPLSSNAGEAAAFIRSTDYHFPQTVNAPNDFTSGENAPDIEIIGAPLAFIHHGEEKPLDNSSIFSIAQLVFAHRATAQSPSRVAMSLMRVSDFPATIA